MATPRISNDILAMLIVSLAFTLVGFVTGAFFLTILCGACLALILIEIGVTRGHITE